MSVLRDQIESLREKLSILALCKELTDIEVIICSRELDKLIVQYEK
jgi:hypothetical protein